ncbi:MAG: mobile mystery protein B [Candidatus Omnitrophica bacterium]|nr:mobile mystery protein B [Candidatus Omnitrophota bacterium]
MAKNLTGPRGEGETPVDDLSGLLIDIKDRNDLDIAESANNSKAHAKYLLFMKSTSRRDLFTHESLFQIHKDMFGEVWSWAGMKRKTGKNLGVPPVKIGSEIDRFLHDLYQWEKNRTEPFEIAVRMHHRLVQIHPFENGNGRWARLVANVYLHQKKLHIIQWPSDEKLIREIFKPRYLAALRKADRGKYHDLLTLHQEYVIDQ